MNLSENYGNAFGGGMWESPEFFNNEGGYSGYLCPNKCKDGSEEVELTWDGDNYYCAVCDEEFDRLTIEAN